MKIKREPQEPQKPERGKRFVALDIPDYTCSLQQLIDTANAAGVNHDDAILQIEHDYDYSSIQFGYWRDETDEEMAPKVKAWEKRHAEWVKKHAAWKQWYKENKGDVEKYLAEKEEKRREKKEKQRLAELKRLEKAMADLEKKRAVLLK